MFRCYDNKERVWLSDVLMLPDGTLFAYEKRKLLSDKLVLIDDKERYIVQYDIALFDKNGCQLYEGDVCDTPDGKGVVAFSEDVGCYCAFNFENVTYYPLTSESCKQIEVTGNVCDRTVYKND